MKNFVLHPATEAALQQVLTEPMHAYLFWGPKGLGKTTLATHVAQEAIASQSAGDRAKWIMCISKLEGKKNISLAQVKPIVEFLHQKLPHGVQKKIVVIDDADTLGMEAANSLLKILEEPPADSVLILVSDQPQTLPTTIRSRLAQVEFKQPSADQIQAMRGSEELVPIVGAKPAVIVGLMADEAARKEFLDLFDLAQKFYESDLEQKLSIGAQVNKRDSEKRFLELLGRVVKGSPTASTALIYADKHLYNSGNPRFVLEHLALELT